MDEKLGTIIKATALLFKKYGIRSISMDDVAREMGISKKTLYQYVENKTDLVKKVLDEHLCHYCSKKNSEEGKNLNAIDVLLEVSKDVNKNFKEFKPTVTYDLQKYYPDLFRSFIDRKRDVLFEDVKNNIQQGIDEGIYRDDLHVELIARLYLKKLENIHDPEFIVSNKFTFKNLFEVMFESHIRGIANQKGIEYLESRKKEFNFFNI